MSDHDAELSRKRAALLREQIADLTGKPAGKSNEPDEDAFYAAPHIYPNQIDNQGSDTNKGANRDNDPTGGRSTEVVAPSGTSEEESSARRDAPRILPLSPREFIERRMREADRVRDGDEKEK